MDFFTNYEDALNFCGGKGYGFLDLIDVVIEKNLLLANELKGQKPPKLDLASVRTLLGLGMCNIQSGPIRVIDFGGGGGYHYNIARSALLPECIIDWRVVETPEMAVRAQALLSNSELQFYDSIESALKSPGEINLVFASSSLQYCPKPIETLQRLTDIKAKHIFITRTPFTSSSKILVSVQKSQLRDNGPGLMPAHFKDRDLLYPITLIPVKYVSEILDKNYKIRFELEEEGGHFVVNDEVITTQYGYFCDIKA